jgi:transposase
MKGARYTDEFKAEAVKQVIDRGHGVVEVAHRLGVSDKSLYVWLKRARQQTAAPATGDAASLRSEVSRLKAELRRTQEERDILKKAAAYFAKLSG